MIYRIDIRKGDLESTYRKGTCTSSPGFIRIKEAANDPNRAVLSRLLRIKSDGTKHLEILDRHGKILAYKVPISEASVAALERADTYLPAHNKIKLKNGDRRQHF